MLVVRQITVRRNENKGVELTVVIINYRTADMVINCLETLLPQLDSESSRVSLVDNDSGDGSDKIIKAWIKQHDKNSLVDFIQSGSNLGFSGGNNIGINSIESDYYLLLNSDTLLRKDSIKKLLTTASRYKEAGIISPRLEWPDGAGQESCFRFHTPISEFLGAAQTGFVDKVFRRSKVALPIQIEIINPEWTSFACVLIRREVLHEIGLMDDEYFMYFEDAEFCFRARKAGWKILHDPSVSVVHLRGGSSPVKENTKLKKRLPKYYYESRARYFYQLYGWSGLTLANLLWGLGRFISKTRQVLGRSDKAVSKKQWLDIWTNWINPLKNYGSPSKK